MPSVNKALGDIPTARSNESSDDSIAVSRNSSCDVISTAVTARNAARIHRPPASNWNER